MDVKRERCIHLPPIIFSRGLLCNRLTFCLIKPTGIVYVPLAWNTMPSGRRLTMTADSSFSAPRATEGPNVHWLSFHGSGGSLFGIQIVNPLLASRSVIPCRCHDRQNGRLRSRFNSSCIFALLPGPKMNICRAGLVSETESSSSKKKLPQIKYLAAGGRNAAN